MKRAMLLLALLLVACAPAPTTGESAAQPASPDAGQTGTTADVELTGTLNVYAAASLQRTFTQMGELLMQEHPRLQVEFVFAGSSDLVAQLEAGAPGDVFASADERNMTKATDAGLMAADPVPFAVNHLAIVTAADNPHGITGLADLANPELTVVICAPQVPCGGATAQVIELAGVTLTPASEETSVTNVLAKVTGGEADAGLVYRTDVAAAGDQVSGVDFPEADQVTNVYPIGALTASRNPLAAQEFVDLVLSDAGQQILARAGFGAAAG